MHQQNFVISQTTVEGQDHPGVVAGWILQTIVFAVDVLTARRRILTPNHLFLEKNAAPGEDRERVEGG